MDQALGAASPGGGSGLNAVSHSLLPSGMRSEVPSSRSSMVDSASEMSESDTDAMSLSGFSDSNRHSSQRHRIEELTTRLATLTQENRVLKIEVDKFKIQVGAVTEENRRLRQASVNIQARAEQEEEFISNTLLKKIQELKKEKETLAIHYEKEEEFLTNQLSKKLGHLRQEKVELERTLEREQEYQVNKLMRRIERLERETVSKHSSLDQLRREKVELENTLEKEQEALVNRLWKKLDRLEHEKRNLQARINENGGASSTKQCTNRTVEREDSSEKVASHVKNLKREVERLRKQLSQSTTEHTKQMKAIETEEKQLREKNLNLQRKLQMEIDRREALHRHLSESESSLEMDEERAFNHELSLGAIQPRGRQITSSPGPFGGYGGPQATPLSSTQSAFIPNASSAFTTPVSPYRNNSAQIIPPGPIQQRPSPRPAVTPDRFVKPSPPPSPGQNRSKEYQ